MTADFPSAILDKKRKRDFQPAERGEEPRIPAVPADQRIKKGEKSDLGAVLVDCSEIKDETGAVVDCSLRLTWMKT